MPTKKATKRKSEATVEDDKDSKKVKSKWLGLFIKGFLMATTDDWTYLYLNWQQNSVMIFYVCNLFEMSQRNSN